ncbi:MAG: hypothetical protein EP311_01135 [Cytophagales bacterium]|nr:MAG: hypothetical protein EP311_01135 [Cytophagales bacterium]
MLEYVKTILQKVSFSRYLFERELKKGLRYLMPSEIEEFRDWCYEMFGRLYLPILNLHFRPTY